MNKHEVPDKPYESGRVISTRIPPETHRALRQVKYWPNLSRCIEP
jgi:hypothetical protein